MMDDANHFTTRPRGIAAVALLDEPDAVGAGAVLVLRLRWSGAEC